MLDNYKISLFFLGKQLNCAKKEKSNMFKRKLTFFWVFLLSCTFGFSQQDSYPYEYYMYIGASASVVYKSEQPLMQNLTRPWHIYIDAGKRAGFLSLRADLSVNQSFKQDFVIMTSQFFSLSLEANTSKVLHKKYGFFAYTGPNLWYSTLGFENTNYLEKDWGWGFDAGAGAYYQLTPSVRLTSHFLYQSSAKGAWFYAGSVNLQNVGTGSYQFLLSISYNLF